MPKIISRGTTVASGKTTQFTDQSVHTYLCLCRTPCLSIDTQLENLPKRKTDGAYVVRSDKHQYKLTGKKLPRITLQRAQGYERQYRFACAECALPICYFPQEEGSTIVYFMAGALRPRYGGAESNEGSTSSSASTSSASSSQSTQAEQSVPPVDMTVDSSGGSSSVRPIFSIKEQERQIKEKLRALETGEELPYTAPPQNPEPQSDVADVKGEGERDSVERDESPVAKRERERSDDEGKAAHDEREGKRARTSSESAGVHERGGERTRDSDRDEDRNRDRGRERSRDRDRGRDRSRERERGRGGDRNRDRDREHRDRHREGDRDGDRSRDRDRDRDRDRRD